MGYHERVTQILRKTIPVLGLVLLLLIPAATWAHRGEQHPDTGSDVAPPSQSLTGEDRPGTGQLPETEESGARRNPLDAARPDISAGHVLPPQYRGLYFDIWFDAPLFGLIAAGVMFWLAIVVWWSRKRSQAFPTRHLYWLLAGLTTFYLGAATSLDEIGEQYLFSAHMLQHCLFIYVTALLILKGLPPLFVEAVADNCILRRPVKLLTTPLVAFALFNINYGVWHYPALYEWALRDRSIHDIEHLSFIGFGLLMWWPVIDPYPRHFPGLKHAGSKMLYIFVNAVAQIPLFAWLSLTRHVRYPTYREAERLLPLSALDDQVTGGIIMKVAALGVFLVVWAVIFFRWYQREQLAEDAPAQDPALENHDA